MHSIPQKRILEHIHQYKLLLCRAGPRCGCPGQANNMALLQTNILQMFVQHFLVGVVRNLFSINKNCIETWANWHHTPYLF